MDLLNNLLSGFLISLSLSNLFFCLTGTIIGTAIGVLPGLGPAATISLLLPVTFRMEPTSAIIMLAGIYYGAMYGGSITSILIKVPGEAASVVTCIDGYQMAKQGKAGKALGTSAFASLIAGAVSFIGIALFGPIISKFALDFGPAEYAALVALGLLLVTLVSATPLINSLLMVCAGLFLSTVGIDPVSGKERFTFGVYSLMDGFNIVTLAMGLFGISELLVLVSSRPEDSQIIEQPQKLRQMLPDKKDWKASANPIARGSVLGFVLGVLPGGGAILASFASYVLEKRISRNPERFGKGAIEGVAGPEAANNAAAQASFLPLLNLGIPANIVTGIMLAALMMHGIMPGPLLIKEQPALFWGVITSMLIGNILLVIQNVPLVGIFVKMLKIPYSILAPLIIFFCIVGAYTVNGDSFEVIIMMVYGIVGFFMRRLDLDPAPLLLAFVLGSMFENSIRQSLLLSNGNLMIFIERPIALGLVICIALAILVQVFSRIRNSWA